MNDVSPLETLARNTIKFAIDNNWKIKKRFDDSEDFFTLKSCFKTIYLYQDWASFDTPFGSESTYGHFADYFDEVQSLYGISQVRKKEKWITKYL